MWGYEDKESIDTKQKNIDQSVQELLTILISQSGREKACVVVGGRAPLTAWHPSFFSKCAYLN